MKPVKIILCIIFYLFVFVHAVYSFSTHNANVYRTFDKIQAPPGNSITVTMSFSNTELENLRGFYYTEHIPETLTVSTISVKIIDNNGNERNISNYEFESGSSGDVYVGYISYRWIIETPFAFDEINSVYSDYTVEIIYTLSSSGEGAFNLDDFSWVGYYQVALPGERAAF